MSGDAPTGAVHRLLDVLHKIEDGLLVSLLFVMIGMAFLQIVLRNTVGTTVSWGDNLVRTLVLWVGLFGAMVATRGDEHINVDLVARHLPPRGRALAGAVVHLFAAGVCGLVAWHAVRFVASEYRYGGDAFAGVPFWACEAVIPLAFAVMCARYALLFVLDLPALRKTA